jgi:hypothetical protein
MERIITLKKSAGRGEDETFEVAALYGKAKQNQTSRVITEVQNIDGELKEIGDI